jgi:hypothetical protein
LGVKSQANLHASTRHLPHEITKKPQSLLRNTYCRFRAAMGERLNLEKSEEPSFWPNDLYSDVQPPHSDVQPPQSDSPQSCCVVRAPLQGRGQGPKSRRRLTRSGS